MFRTVDGAVVSFLYQLWVETEVAGGEGVMCPAVTCMGGWICLRNRICSREKQLTYVAQWSSRGHRLIQLQHFGAFVSVNPMIPTGLYGWHLLMLYRFVFRYVLLFRGPSWHRLEVVDLSKGQGGWCSVASLEIHKVKKDYHMSILYSKGPEAI